MSLKGLVGLKCSGRETRKNKMVWTCKPKIAFVEECTNQRRQIMQQYKDPEESGKKKSKRKPMKMTKDIKL